MIGPTRLSEIIHKFPIPRRLFIFEVVNIRLIKEPSTYNSETELSVEPPDIIQSGHDSSFSMGAIQLTSGIPVKFFRTYHRDTRSVVEGFLDQGSVMFVEYSSDPESESWRSSPKIERSAIHVAVRRGLRTSQMMKSPKDGVDVYILFESFKSLLKSFSAMEEETRGMSMRPRKTPPKSTGFETGDTKVPLMYPICKVQVDRALTYSSERRILIETSVEKGTPFMMIDYELPDPSHFAWQQETETTPQFGEQLHFGIRGKFVHNAMDGGNESYFDAYVPMSEYRNVFDSLVRFESEYPLIKSRLIGQNR
jgi:hypothetical protein